jgi:hypothetical protein
MTRFEELCELASRRIVKFEELKRQTIHAADGLVGGWNHYLGVSDEDWAKCYEVDREMKKTKARFTQLPELCFHYDTFWYFIMAHDFVDPANPPLTYHVEFPVGLKKVDEGFLVKMPAGDDYLVAGNAFDDTTGKNEQAFYNEMFNRLKELLANPWVKPPKLFGFHASPMR